MNELDVYVLRLNSYRLKDFWERACWVFR